MSEKYHPYLMISYQDPKPFITALNIMDKSDPYVFLVAHTGEIKGRYNGEVSNEKVEKIMRDYVRETHNE